MRTTLFSVLAVLAQWGIPANAQPQAGTPPTWPTVTNGYLAHRPTKRLFFFISDPKNMGRATLFGRPAQPAAPGSFLAPESITNPVPHTTVKFPSTGLLPKETLPPQDLRRFLKPKNSKLFFFGKP